MVKIVIPVLLSIFLLTGCVGFGAQAISTGNYLAGVADAFMREQHANRQWIRKECLASLIREVDKLKQKDNEAAVRELLGQHYPDLVTVSILKSLKKDPEGIAGYANICGKE